MTQLNIKEKLAAVQRMTVLKGSAIQQTGDNSLKQTRNDKFKSLSDKKTTECDGYDNLSQHTLSL